MEFRDFALAVVTSDVLDVKLAPPAGPLTDDHPGTPLRLEGPGRPEDLTILPAPKVKVPSIDGMADPAQRPRILHALANHELQAAELFAWALLAFPDAPAEMRRGLRKILDDEQRHTRMYVARLKASGGRLGDHPVSGYFWRKAEHLHTPLHFVCAMSLTFENANLDHTVDYAAAARRAGDEKTALVIERVGRDEEDHVRFGWRWLRELGGDRDPWDVYREHLTWPLRPAKARGKRFHPEGRRRAGLDEGFIRRLEASPE
ncbi:MAG: DUF455 family protein [Acidobacteriota bacterium]